MDFVDTIVIGAGVVGLAVAKAFVDAGHEVIVIEADNSFGTGTSSRNSEVIHAGIYYPAGGLKAQFCVNGKRKLYEYVRDRNVPFNQCGKFIVATNENQLSHLDSILQKARANGVLDLAQIGPDQVSEHEPEIYCVGALFSPTTGIIDSHGYMQALLGDIENNGGALVTNTRFERAEVHDRYFVVHTVSDQAFSLRCKNLINCAGLFAHEVAVNIDGLASDFVPNIYYAKGNYFTITDRPFSHLIYPVPEPGGLGVHVTLDLGRSVKFGPDVEWINTINYDVDINRASRFYDAIRRYYPNLRDNALNAGYAGIRPKLRPQGQTDSDFHISLPTEHGIRGLANLYAIESPGLTSSLAIADYVKSNILANVP